MASTIAREFKSHAIWEQLEAFDQTLVRVEPMLAEADVDTVSRYGSLKALVGYVASVLRSVNPVLVPVEKLVAIESAVNQSLSYLQRFENDRDVGLVDSAWTVSPAILDAVSVLPMLKARADTKGLVAAITAFEDQLVERFRGVDSYADEVDAELAGLRETQTQLAGEIATQTGHLETATDEFRTGLAADQATRSEEYASALTDIEEALQRVEDESSAIAERDRQLRDAQIDDFKAQFAALQAEWNEEATAAGEHREAEAEARIARLEEHLATAKSLVEMLGEVTMTGHYQKNAVEQKAAADKWRIGAVAVGAVAVVSAIIIVVTGIKYRNDLNLADYVSHAGVTLAIVTLATFLGSQSASHRRREEQYRALELELATLDPFLSSLEAEDRLRIKSSLALRFFKGIDPENAETGGSLPVS